jgi:hypothetical protein
METITLNPEFLRSLILKLRALMAQEGLVTPGGASNPADDDSSPAALQDSPDNLTQLEVRSQIEDLEPDQQAELVALMWIGRGDMEPEEWEEALEQAAQEHGEAVADYLLSHPHVADHLDEGVDRLLDGSDLMETGEY